MGPMCFDYGFGPFRWVCSSCKQEDLDITDTIACEVLEKLALSAPEDTKQQMMDNIQWIKAAKENELVVGSKARILYADSNGRIEIAKAFNKAIKEGKIGPIILGRDHHDVSGTDSPYRETSTFMMVLNLQLIWLFKMLLEIVLGVLHGFIHNGGGDGWEK